MRKAPCITANQSTMQGAHTNHHRRLIRSLYQPPAIKSRGDGYIMKYRRRKTIWAYLNGKKLVDVVQAALDNNMTVDDMKALLIRENPGHEVAFKVL